MTLIDTRPTPAKHPGPGVRWLTDSRPRASGWSPPPIRGPLQPMLTGLDTPARLPEVGALRRAPGRPPDPDQMARGLRDPAGWVAVLAVAVRQAVVGQRPVGQLERWLSEPVLADVTYAARRDRRPARGEAPVLRPSVISVHTQCPSPGAAEVAVHLRVGSRSLAMACRLEVVGRRWLCTALERGPSGDVDC